MLKEFVGGAATVSLAANIDSDDLTFTTSATGGWPNGATAPFVVSIVTAGATEKLLCSNRTGNVFTVQQRGYDDTVAAAHTAGDQVKHVLDAGTVQEANTFINEGGSIGGPLLLPNYGSPEASLAFSTDPDTGLFYAASGKVGFISNDTPKVTLDSSGLYPWDNRTYQLGEPNFAEWSDVAANRLWGSNDGTTAHRAGKFLIETKVGTGASGGIAFSSIPANYGSLYVVFRLVPTTTASCYLRFNNDSATNYTYAFYNSSITSAAQINLNHNNSLTTSNKGTGDVLIPNYSQTTMPKSAEIRSSVWGGSATVGPLPGSGTLTGLNTFMGGWANNAAINRVDFILSTGNFTADTQISLYGLVN